MPITDVNLPPEFGDALAAIVSIAKSLEKATALLEQLVNE